MAGGFTVPRSVFKLRFDGDQYDGMVVKVRAMSIAEMIEMAEDFDGDLLFNGELTPTMASNTDRLFEWFLTFATEWNLEEEGGAPVPLTIVGLNGQELPFALTIITTWLAGCAGVGKDLKEGLTSGQPSPEASLPMEAL